MCPHSMPARTKNTPSQNLTWHVDNTIEQMNSHASPRSFPLSLLSLMSFGCDRLQVCYMSPSDLKTPALVARRSEPATVCLESLRKLRFRNDGLQENARHDLIQPMVEVLRALAMDNTKVHLLEIGGIPADAQLSQKKKTQIIHAHLYALVLLLISLPLIFLFSSLFSFFQCAL